MKPSIFSRIFLICIVISFAGLAGYGIVSSGSNHSQATQPDGGKGDISPPAKSGDSPIVELPAQLKLSLLAVHPHDSRAFTQGLEFYKGQLYESTGQYGHSTLRRVEIATGKVLQEHPLARQYFGEGITLLGDKIYQLTWQEKTCFVYDRETFRQDKTFAYPGEGWGLTNDGTHLIMSDGTSRIRFLNSDTFQPVRVIDVRDGNKRVTLINELEYIHGEIWANMLGSKYIVRINPADGRVINWINCTNFIPKEIAPNDPERVLNGIAFDSKNNRIYITGKLWPVLYELKLND